MTTFKRSQENAIREKNKKRGQGYLGIGMENAKTIQTSSPALSKNRFVGGMTSGDPIKAASTYAASNQGTLQLPVAAYGAGKQSGGAIPSSEVEKEPRQASKQTYQKGSAFEEPAGFYTGLPTPKERNEVEVLREEVRQQTQLAKGITPEKLAERSKVNEGRTYRITSQDLARQYDIMGKEIAKTERMLGKTSIAEETFPGGAVAERMEALHQWKEILEKKRDSLASPYYYLENEEKRAALSKDPVSWDQFRSIGETREDLRRLGDLMVGDSGCETGQRELDYLMEKYGMTERELRQKAPQLILELQGRWDAEEQELAKAGYDYGRMMDYDKMLGDTQKYGARQKNLETFAKEHPVLASGVSMGMAPFQLAEFAGSTLGSWGHSDTKDLKSYVPINFYNWNVTNTVNTLRGTVAEEIERNTDWELFGQNVTSFFYQTGMSIGDSALQVGALGRAATLFMGGSAAADQAQSVMARGGNNEQAFWGGLAAGAAEMLFEYVSIDNLLKPRTVTGWESFLRETVRQAGVEGSEELFTEIANILSDAAIMGNQSETALRTAAYQNQGMSREEAERQTFLDCIGQAAWAAAGGGLSGGVMGGVVSGVNWAGNTKTALVSDATADQMLGEWSTVRFLTRKGGLNLTEGMSQEQRRAAVRQAVENIVGGKLERALLTEKGSSGIVGARVRIEYDSNKLNNYLLNLDHPEGKSKAKFLYDVLGYSRGDGKILYNNIKQALEGQVPIKTTKTAFGIKFEYDINLLGREGKNISARVIVVLQRDHGKISYRIITLYPGKREIK